MAVSARLLGLPERTRQYPQPLPPFLFFFYSLPAQEDYDEKYHHIKMTLQQAFINVARGAGRVAESDA